MAAAASPGRPIDDEVKTVELTKGPEKHRMTSLLL